MSKFEEYLEMVHFPGLKETEEQNCKICKHKSLYSPTGEKRDFPACKMYGLAKGSHMNCEDFEKED